MHNVPVAVALRLCACALTVIYRVDSRGLTAQTLKTERCHRVAHVTEFGRDKLVSAMKCMRERGLAVSIHSSSNTSATRGMNSPRCNLMGQPVSIGIISDTHTLPGGGGWRKAHPHGWQWPVRGSPGHVHRLTPFCSATFLEKDIRKGCTKRAGYRRKKKRKVQGVRESNEYIQKFISSLSGQEKSGNDVWWGGNRSEQLRLINSSVNFHKTSLRTP